MAISTDCTLRETCCKLYSYAKRSPPLFCGYSLKTRPSPYLAEFFQESIPLAIAMGSEKARSELIISPILFEVRKILDRKISFFSREEFTIDASVGLNGVCDFLISRFAGSSK